MKRLPTAVLYNDKTKDSTLFVRAQAVFNGLTNNVAYFAAPPYDPTELNDLYTEYYNTSTAAIKGTKAQTTAKREAKQALIEALRADATYVTQRVYTDPDSQNGLPGYEHARLKILQSGFEVSKRVTRPNSNGNAKSIVVLNTTAKTETGKMNVAGILKVRVKSQKKFDSQSVKTYWIQYRMKVTSPTPVNTWSDFTATSTNIQVTGLDAGIYEYMVAPIVGQFMGKNQLNWSPMLETVVT